MGESPRRVTRGEEEYDDLLREYNRNGGWGISQFSDEGSWGGHLVHVTGTEETPIFHIVAEAGPTLAELDVDRYGNCRGANVVQDGWASLWPDKGELRIRPNRRTGGLKIRKMPLPGRE